MNSGFRKLLVFWVIVSFIFLGGCGGGGLTSISTVTPVDNTSTTGAVSGTVRDASTNAISGATVTCGGRTATTNDSGAYLISGLTPGTLTITATKDGYGINQASINISAGHTTYYNIILYPQSGPTGSVSGTVTDRNGNPLAGAVVACGGSSTMTDTSGAYTIERASAGEQTITAIKAGYSNYSSTVTVMEGVTVTKNITLEPEVITAGEDIVIPEVASPDGGVITASSGSVYYFNELHTAEESDIRLTSPTAGSVTTKRYLLVSGKAIPDDSGYTDRRYHSVLFGVLPEGRADDETDYFNFPVDENGNFSGYIYFDTAGKNTVYAYRARNDMLYPSPAFRSTAYKVSEGWSTLTFTVNVLEAVPAAYLHLLPTRAVNCGNSVLRNYAANICAGKTTDVEKARAIFEFLVKGDQAGPFIYTVYNEIYPGYLNTPWETIFLASHFLQRRRGVCNDFAELFAAMGRSQGLKIKLKSGTYPATGAEHEWNIIYLNGSWVSLDATWANNNYSTSGGENWKKYAGFYDEFDEASFHRDHDGTYSKDQIVRY